MLRCRLAVAAAVVLAVLASSASSLGGSSSPSISTGGLQTCAVVAGGLKCWGDNAWGELGNETKLTQLVPAPVSGLSSGLQAVAAGLHHTCAVAAGGVKCWGWNVNGQLGDGTETNRSRPVSVRGLSTGVKAIAAAGGHSCALLDSGGVECWGDNFAGELGDGTRDTRRTPVPVSGLTSGVATIAAAGDVGEFSCALLVSGGIECWGDNQFGQIGNGTELDFQLTPVAVAGLSSGVKAIAAGGGLNLGHTCALLDSGGVKCWGGNQFGQLGDGTKTNRLRPVAVSGLSSGVKAIATGDGHTCALLDSGTVKCWGWNDAGQLGDGTASNRSTPVAVRGLRGVQAITAGNGDTCALLSVGAVQCWGLNDYGELGDGTELTRTRPVKVIGLAPGMRALMVRVQGLGTVTGAGIRCANACGYERPQGTRLVLTARPANGWSFKAWYGVCKGHSRRCTLRLAATETTVARFVKLRPL